MRHKLLFLTTLLALMAALPLRAGAEELTVYNGTEYNKYVPIYGYYADSYLKCEYVIPAEALSAMEGATITSLTWYLQTSATDSWGSASFQVFVKEITPTTLSSYSGTAGATMVYEGSLDGTGTTMTVNFTTPYVYEGGNLLIGVYNTVKGTYFTSYFYGETVSGASVQGYNGESLDAVTANQRDFIPKTTFTYTPSSGVVYHKPSDLTVSDITPNGAKLAWTPGGNETAWNVEYIKIDDEQWTSLPVTTPSCTLEDLHNGETYYVRVQSDYGSGNLSGWATTSFTTPACEEEDMCEITYELIDEWGDGWSSNAIQVVNSHGVVVATLTVPSGSSNNGTLKLCYGEPYDFVWVTGTYSYECTFTITDSEGEVILSHQGSRNAGETEPPTAGRLITYTPSLTTCIRPTDLTATSIAYNSATLTWTPGDPDQDRWQVIYHAGDFDPDNVSWDPTTVTVNPTCKIEGLSQNTTYTAYVRSECNAGEYSNWSAVCTFTTPTQFPTPTDLAITDVTAHAATATWAGEAEVYNLMYRKAAYDEKILFESFENGIPEGWTLVDSDADGRNWSVSNVAANYGGYGMAAYDGNYALMSCSYDGSGFEPDNWIITPKVDLGGMLKYWIMDDGTYCETYRIYVSTTDADLASFTPITDDISSPGSRQWTECSVDLSAYANQKGYIAFRHYNCENEDLMLIDAIGIYGAHHEAGDYVMIGGITGHTQRLEGLTPDTDYEVSVQGTYGEAGATLWADATFTTPVADKMPAALAVADIADHTATVSWTGAQESYNLRYRATAKRIGFFEDFEGGDIPETWTNIDADGDGNKWYIYNPAANGNSKLDRFENLTVLGECCATSASYNGSALTPDNWLVTPQVELKGKLRVWLRSQDPAYPEHFAIYASTTGNTVDDFTIVLADTTVAEGVYTEYVFDLSEYNGEMGYIAIRHFDVKDMFRLNVDNFFIQHVETQPGEWVTLEGVTAPQTLTGLTAATEYEVQVQGIIDDDVTTDWIASVLFTTLESPSVPGDLNGDNIVDVADVNLMINVALNIVSAEDLMGNADLNGDGTIDVGDLNLVINMLLEQ